MISYQLKIVLTLLSAVLFSFFFIILAMIAPTHDEKVATWKPQEKSKTRVGQISKSMREGFGQ